MDYIKQTDFWNNIHIHTSGCLFISLLTIAQKVSDRKLDKHDILDIYKIAIEKDIMDANCYVKNHSAIIDLGLSFIGKDMKSKYLGAQYLSGNRESWGRNNGAFIILQVKTSVLQNSHFRLVEWDPYYPSPVFNSILSVRYYSVA